MQHINSLQNSVGKYISNKMLRKFQNSLVCLSNTSAKKVEDSAETLVHYASSGFSIPQHFAKDYGLVF